MDTNIWQAHAASTFHHEDGSNVFYQHVYTHLSHYTIYRTWFKALICGMGQMTINGHFNSSIVINIKHKVKLTICMAAMFVLNFKQYYLNKKVHILQVSITTQNYMI
jgi:hypothetical protein